MSSSFRFSCLSRHVNVYVGGATSVLRVRVDVAANVAKPYQKIVGTSATLTLFTLKEGAEASLATIASPRSSGPLRSPRMSAQMSSAQSPTPLFPIRNDERDDALCVILSVLYANPNSQEISSTQPSQINLTFGIEHHLVSMMEELRVNNNVWLDLKLSSSVVHEQQGSRDLFVLNAVTQTIQVEIEAGSFLEMMQRVPKPAGTAAELSFEATVHGQDATRPPNLGSASEPPREPPDAVSDGPMLLANGNYNECVLMCYDALKRILQVKVRDRKTGEMYSELAEPMDRNCTEPKSVLFLANLQGLLNIAQLADRGLKGYNAFSKEEAAAVFDQTVAMVRLFGDGLIHIE